MDNDYIYNLFLIKKYSYNFKIYLICLKKSMPIIFLLSNMECDIPNPPMLIMHLQSCPLIINTTSKMRKYLNNIYQYFIVNIVFSYMTTFFFPSFSIWYKSIFDTRTCLSLSQTHLRWDKLGLTSMTVEFFHNRIPRTS